jgi:sigma-B regulation protein RsbU (phosphoserine phosphatase)
MIDALNTDASAGPEGVLRNVRASVDEFVGIAEQFDDITMLCLEYRGLQDGACIPIEQKISF